MEEKKDEERSLSLEEMIREGEMIEKELENDESLTDIPFPEDLDRKVMEKIRLYEESLEREEKEAKAAEEKSENKDNFVRIKKKRPGVFLLVAVIAVLVFAFGINSVGSVPFFTKKSELEVGDRKIDRLNTNKETNKETETSLGTEEKAFQEIEDIFGVVPVSFGYVPEHMVFEKYHIDKNLNNVDVLYGDGEYLMDYQMMFEYNEAVRGYDVDERIIEEDEQEVLGTTIKINKSKTDDGKDIYKAQFMYNGVQYILNAVMEKDEFYKIIENLIFM